MAKTDSGRSEDPWPAFLRAPRGKTYGCSRNDALSEISKPLRTLRDAGHFIMSLPMKDRMPSKWRTAIRMLR
jgi:hypothetical protein